MTPIGTALLAIVPPMPDERRIGESIGRSLERSRIVAWLRAQEIRGNLSRAVREEMTVGEAADAIERGDHLTKLEVP